MSNNDRHHYEAIRAYTDAAWWCFLTSLKCFVVSVLLALVGTFVVWDVVWGLAALAWVLSIAWAVFSFCFCILSLTEEVCGR